jgi:hypothetical protein
MNKGIAAEKSNLEENRKEKQLWQLKILTREFKAASTPSKSKRSNETPRYCHL